MNSSRLTANLLGAIIKPEIKRYTQKEVFFMRRSFYPDFSASDTIHRPLAIHPEETREARCAKKAVLSTRLLDEMKSLDHFEAVGDYASISLSRTQTHNGLSSLCLKTPVKLDHWPRAYGRIYSISSAYLKIDHEDWTAYNQVGS